MAWKIQNLASVGPFLAHTRVVLMRSNSVAYRELPRKAAKYSDLCESFWLFETRWAMRMDLAADRRGKTLKRGSVFVEHQTLV